MCLLSSSDPVSTRWRYFFRDLGISGRVFVNDKENGKIRQVSGLYLLFYRRLCFGNS
jgi:hypothetical protein